MWMHAPLDSHMYKWFVLADRAVCWLLAGLSEGTFEMMNVFFIAGDMLLIQSPPATSDILSYATHATAQSLTLTPSHCDIPSATYYWHHRSVHGLCV